MNSKVHRWHTNLDEQEDVFQKWIDVFDDETRISLRQNYFAFKNKIHSEGNAVTLFASGALLRLIEQIILNFNTLQEKQIKDVDDEMALLEAWLVNNATFDLEVAEGTKPLIDNLLGVLLVNQASQYEFVKRKDFAYQTLLAYTFFEFLANDLDLNVYLKQFLSCKQVQTYSEYLSHLIGVYGDGLKGDSFGFGIAPDSIEALFFFDSIAYDLSADPFANLQNNKPDPDYKLLRTRPLIKQEDSTYYPVHLNFFVDKIYQGLLFDFYQHSSIRDKYKDFGKFLGFLGQEFAETQLFDQYLISCFLPKKYLVAVSGNEYSKIEYSDYYVRESNALYLFEFKNSIINAQIKQSKNFDKIKTEILKKLVYSPENNKKKGVGQLLNVIHKVAEGGFVFDDLVGKRVGRLHIFPIIIHTDDFFALDGVQNIISEEFSILLKQKPIKRHQVNDITLMHLQDIIDIQFLVQSGKTTFKDIIQTYFINKKTLAKKKPQTPQELLDKYSGFRPLVQNIVKSYGDHEALLSRLTKALGLQ